ncbi:Gamma-butyrobetaine dioxygenase [Varanus komodoensis]|nr:Gamma-butyrobetaine dioxygenase [Varanus komodoensis]
MWKAIAKYLLRSKVHQDWSRRLLQAQKGKHSHRRHFCLSRGPWHHSLRTAQAFQALGTHAAIQKVEALEANQFVCVHWEDGSQSLYPSVWLRDNCQCPDCFLGSAKARKLLLENLDVNIGTKNVTSIDRKKVYIIWPDDHTSEFEAEWLKKRCFSEQARAKIQEELFLPEVLNRCVRDDEDIKGTRIRDESYKLQAFADDLVFIMEEPFSTMPKLLQQIEEYGEVTGMKINREKTKLLVKNVTREQKERLQEQVDLQIVKKIIRYGDILDKDGGLKLEQEIQEQGLNISWWYKVQMQSRYAKDCKTWEFYRDLTEFDQVMLKIDEKIIKRLYDFLLDRKMEGE